MPKSKKEKNDAAVRWTNDRSSLSKASICTLGYFQDDYITHLVKKARRSPLINRGYYVRAKAIDGSLKAFLGAHQGQSKQIISLGAGFDSAYFRLKSAGLLEETTFIEVDFPEVVERKADIIESNAVFWSLLEEPVDRHVNKGVHGVWGISSKSYQLLGVSLDNLSLLNDLLVRCGCDFRMPTLLLSECVMTYMDVERSDDLIEYCAKTFPNAVFICYEQIYPSDPFGRVMMQHFQKLMSPLKAIRTYPTLEDHQERFLKLGWHSTRVVDMNQFYSSLEKTERERVDRIEPFDEFEEWHLTCNHYILVTACKGSCLNVYKDESLPKIHEHRLQHFMGPLQASHQSHVVWASRLSLAVFGHACVKLSSDVFITGGVSGGSLRTLDSTRGVSYHVRRSSMCKLNLLSGVIEGPFLEHLGRMYHSMTCVNDDWILVFGGRSSPNKPSETALIKLNRGGDTTSYSLETVSCQDCEFTPEPRWRHSATSIRYNDEGAVLICGGRDRHSVFGDCAIFDVERKWHRLQTTGSLPEDRHSHTASLLGDDRVVVACGLGSDGEPLNSIFTLQCQSWIWTQFTTTPEIRPRYSHTAHILEDHLLLVGGVHIHGEVVPSVTRISLTTGCWAEYTLTVIDPERVLMLHGHESVIHGEDLIIIGGGGNCFSFGTHFNELITRVSLPSDWIPQ